MATNDVSSREREPAAVDRFVGRRFRWWIALLALPAAVLAQQPLSAQAPADALHAVLEDWEERDDGPGPDQLASVTDESRRDRLEAVSEALERIRAIDANELEGEDAITYQVFRRSLEQRLEAGQHPGHLLPFTSDTGFFISLARMPTSVPLRTVEDYRNYIARVRDMPRYVDEHVDLLRRGLETGVTQPRVVVEAVMGPIEAQVVDGPESSDFFRPFDDFPPTVPEGERAALVEEGRAAVAEGALPAFRELHDFMSGEYLPRTRSTVGILEVPGGDAYYEFLVRDFTTLDITPEEVHQLGLSEVARIRAEMQAIIDEVGFQGGFDAFLAFLRSDPRFYETEPEELLEFASRVSKRIDLRLPTLFHVETLPRMPYGVEPVPPDIAPGYTAGRYVSAPDRGSRGGIYWVNTFALESRPLYAIPALTLHEAVPGHHLQIAIANELEGLPPIRSSYYSAAYQEGWALYAERLGLEIDTYRTPYEDFGRLTYEMWRACRLVVDTGIHAKGWSRQQAVDFLAENTALSLLEVGTEVTRYISWPGQALAYKMGELKIRELRAEAEEALGDDFDVRDFHAAVLTHGQLPLTVLEDVVREYIAGAGESDGS